MMASTSAMLPPASPDGGDVGSVAMAASEEV
jgi:hypothetical protein